MFGSKITLRGTLPDPKVIGNDPSRHILASKVSQNHRPSTFGVLLESTLTMVVEVVVVVVVVGLGFPFWVGGMECHDWDGGTCTSNRVQVKVRDRVRVRLRVRLRVPIPV